MNNNFSIEIIEQQIDSETVKTISARELHQKLEVKKDFSSWIKYQIKKAMLTENMDFITTHQKRGVANGGHKMVLEYYLTIDSAKHIALMSGTIKGRDIRNYFIEVEKKYRLQNSEPVLESKSRDDLISVSDSELDRELKALKFILDNFNLSEKEKIEVSNRVFEKINFETLENPHLRKQEQVFTLTVLLNDFGINMRTADFNKKLESFGIIERFGNGWILLDMKFGENRNFKEGKNHRYYRSTFEELLDLVL